MIVVVAADVVVDKRMELRETVGENTPLLLRHCHEMGYARVAVK